MSSRVMVVLNSRYKIMRHLLDVHEPSVHRPIAPCTSLHEPGSAQRDGFDEPGVSRQHSGCAVVPAGTSVGHGPEATASRRRIGRDPLN